MGKLKDAFETGLAGVGCFLGLALIVGLLFAPLLPFLAIIAAVWAFAKLLDAIGRNRRPALTPDRRKIADSPCSRCR